MFPNSRPSEEIALVASVNPGSLSVGNSDSGWVSMGNFMLMLAVLATGVLGASATMDMKFQQATDANGTNAKDVPGKAIAQVVKATGDNKQVLLNLRSSDLDVEGGFSFIRIRVATGTAASAAAALLFGCSARIGEASPMNAASVVQVA